MIDPDNQSRVRETALNQFCALHQRNQAGHARDGNRLHRTTRAMLTGEVSRQWRATSLPTTFLIDRQGIIRDDHKLGIIRITAFGIDHVETLGD